MNIQDIEERLMELWIEVASEMGIEYKVSVNAGKKFLTPVNPDQAYLRQFGSGTQNIQAEFWLEKIKSEFHKRAKSLKL